MKDINKRINNLLQDIVSSTPGVPGVSAVVTNKTENIYVGAAGKRTLGGDVDMTPDSVCAIFSTTKAITGTVCLQLMEKGELDLDAPAKEYAPKIGDLKVIDGFDNKGKPILREPKTNVTTRQLLLHQGGFGYDFFNETYHRLAQEHNQPSVITATHASLNTPMLFDPGTAWEYGTSVDWAGQVCEKITGKRLGQLMKEGVFDPLGMDNSAFTMTESMKDRYTTMHQRDEKGVLTALTDFMLDQDPEVHMGGHGLHSTALDYAKFIRMWLNDGASSSGQQVLKPETVRVAEKNGLGDMKIKALPGVIPSLSNDAEFFPGMPKSWGLTFMINDEDAPTGRPAGSLAWAGLANLYFWIDRKNGIGGYWATQILPFADATSVNGYLEMERIVYQSMAPNA
ncbi:MULTISPECIES: serine hydrolase domain-containing protein [Psychrobacter]|jgi:methyl acetate hydrolase|uniref:Beta-lactamase family protein n=1 Tax=Psychrobacter halodurans TaxID=2818439 RepID=A0AAW4IQE8_9GAMM|nr:MULTISPECIES: serine hydrolase domain-containing protein [Psychrobacter]MBO1516956.1 beta-lactamase family protein [Psychrobacter halodurans]